MTTLTAGCNIPAVSGLDREDQQVFNMSADKILARLPTILFVRQTTKIIVRVMTRQAIGNWDRDKDEHSIRNATLLMGLFATIVAAQHDGAPAHNRATASSGVCPVSFNSAPRLARKST